MKVPFWKVESIGNDFPLFRAEDLGGHLGAPCWADRVQKLTDRHFGIGGDGVLTLEVLAPDRFRLRMFNPDGTEDFCGNGIRTAAWLAYRQGWAGPVQTIHHGDREIPVAIEGDHVATTLGQATYDPAMVPTSATYEMFGATVWAGMIDDTPLSFFGSALSTGSTHVVIPTASLPHDPDFAEVSQRIEHDHKFPQRTSVIWAETVGRDELRIRIWERGVGETQGCGTGSSAAAADYLRRQSRGGSVVVHNPGGDVEVRAEAWNAPLTIRGTARLVYAGSVAIER
ncbi:MAG: diaminopimelate epimerase [Fimbriimonadaceae bacterium]|nr:diaminopimelate epimerase [Fimbriimonadaceae bacterium]